MPSFEHQDTCHSTVHCKRRWPVSLNFRDTSTAMHDILHSTTSIARHPFQTRFKRASTASASNHSSCWPLTCPACPLHLCCHTLWTCTATFIVPSLHFCLSAFKFNWCPWHPMPQCQLLLIDHMAVLHENTFDPSPHNQLLNLSGKAGLSLCQDGVEKVCDLCNGEVKTLQPFPLDLAVHGDQCNWSNALNVPNETCSRLRHHGHLTEANAQPFSQKFHNQTSAPGERAINAVGCEAPTVPVHANTCHWNPDPQLNWHCKDAICWIQNQCMLHQCIKGLLTAQFKKSLLAKLPDVDDDGVQPLWWLLQKVPITACVTACNLKLQAQKLDPLNLQLWHQETPWWCIWHHLHWGHQSQGQISPSDQMICLFMSHKKINDPKFQVHLTMMETQWSSGLLTAPLQLQTGIKMHCNVLVANEEICI